MSSAYKCDRCGALYEYDYRMYGNNMHFIGRRPQKDSELDLCPTCQKSLENWFKLIAKVKEKNNEN